MNSAAPLMNDNGSIIFNGSVRNYLGQPGLAAYAVTKGGLVSMARSIAADLAPRKIRVNVVAPGATKTPIWKRGFAPMPRQRNPQKFPTSSLPRFHLPVGASRKICQGCAFSCLGRFVVHQRGRADGGWRTDGRSLRSSHSS
jgi:NAD(P)-dependent dehydrogenase (short-subunit alcohol dehydrogenase family)